jgi:lipopolysaccharide transport system ATP-binding protein
MPPIIKVDGLSKRYWLRHQPGARYRALREEIGQFASAPFRAAARLLRGQLRDPAGRPTEEEFWALKDVSFAVDKGDVVGIIGSNGAGKSTLLKILSRITEPTRGRIEIEGRVASLLEVGTGFHPELTGRENIFLNGAILGMSRAEIRAKFDEIVAFAEVEKFLDSPVKRYSSGMYVRLAFAVAAHLEPEILVVDEVLAVGDAQFQKKCLGKMKDVSAKEGRTVLFVSHQMGTVRQLCTRGILLKAGQIAAMGSAAEVVDAYVSLHLGGKEASYVAAGGTQGKDIAIETAWTSNGAEMTSYFLHTDPITINVSCRVNRWVPNSELRLVVDDSRGRRVFTADVMLNPPPANASEPGLIRAEATLPIPFLRPETYLVTVATFVNNQFVIDIALNAFTFIVQDGGSKYSASEGMDYGCVFSPCQWTLAYHQGASRPQAERKQN